MAVAIMEKILQGTLSHSGLIQTNVRDVWSVTEGLGIKIAVLDTGAFIDHKDLHENILGCYNGLTCDSNVTDKHERAHGTSIAGIIGAHGHKDESGSSVGYLGVAPKAGLLIGKVIEGKGNVDPEAIIRGIEWAMKEEADIINMSLQCTSNKKVEDCLRHVIAAGKFVLCGAGNQGGYANGIAFPASMNETISVGSVDKRNEIASLSSWGKLDIVAPGEAIWSTYRDQKYILNSGTSMACAFATGIAALALSKHRDKTKESVTPLTNNKQLKNHLKVTANQTIWDFKEGDDRQYGAGLIDPRELVLGRRDNKLTLEFGDFQASGIEKIKRISCGDEFHLRSEGLNKKKEPVSIVIKKKIMSVESKFLNVSFRSRQVGNPQVADVKISVPFSDYEVALIDQRDNSTDPAVSGEVNIVIDRLGTATPLPAGVNGDYIIDLVITIENEILSAPLNNPTLDILFQIIDKAENGPVDEKKKSQIKPSGAT